jgi:arylsulfatase A-like enzyme
MHPASQLPAARHRSTRLRGVARRAELAGVRPAGVLAHTLVAAVPGLALAAAFAGREIAAQQWLVQGMDRLALETLCEAQGTWLLPACAGGAIAGVVRALAGRRAAPPAAGRARQRVLRALALAGSLAALAWLLWDGTGLASRGVSAAPPARALAALAAAGFSLASLPGALGAPARWAGAAALALAAATLGARALEGEPPGPSVLLIVADTLRADRLGAYGHTRDTSPFLDSLARRGVRFERVYANAPWTAPSVASLLTSWYPTRHGVTGFFQALPDRVLTLAEILTNEGYRTWFFNGGNVHIDAPANFLQGFQSYHSEEGYARGETRGEDLTDAFLERLDEIAADGKFFVYLHYMDTHAPYHPNRFNATFEARRDRRWPPAPGNELDALRRLPALLASRPKEAWDLRRRLVDRYDGQVRYLDSQVERVVTALEKRGLFESTLLVFTSDHGEEFLERDSWGHGRTLYEEMVRVPLILAGAVPPAPASTATAQLVDVVPTVLGRLGVSPGPADFEGVDLLDGADPPAARTVFAEGTPGALRRFMILDGDTKLIRSHPPRHPERVQEQIFDLLRDPHEEQDLAGSFDPQRREELRRRLSRHMEEAGEVAAEVPIGAGQRAALEALGYVE